MNCPKCGKPFVKHHGTCQTLVGYSSPPGHDHDDNCRSRMYECEDGHRTGITAQNHCHAEGCDWAGKTKCFCHHGDKLAEWPALVQTRPAPKEMK